MLNKERDLIGIYLSAHPLDEYETILRYVCNVSVTELTDKDALGDREISFGGLVVDSVEKISRFNTPFIIMKIEDFTGSGEIALFGEDYINFGKYARKGLYVYVKGRIQGRKFKPEIKELKITSIDLLQDVKDSLIDKITIQLPLHSMNNKMIDDLVTLTSENKGNSSLYFEIIDGEKNMRIDMFARSSKIQVNKEIMDYLTNEENNLSFKINN